MPTIITHALVAGCVGVVAGPEQRDARFWSLAVACSILPDLDVLGFALGIPYGHPLGHRGLLHSPFVGLLVGLLVTLLFYRHLSIRSRRWWHLCGFFGMITASHGLLDAFTNGGLGIALLAPFDNGRFFAPWTPIQVSPIGLRYFFTSYGWETLKSEMLWVWLPSATMVALSRLRGTGPTWTGAAAAHQGGSRRGGPAGPPG
jgi:inner membrane protein